MTDKQHGSSTPTANILHFADGFLLKLGIADSENLVDDEDFGLHEGGDSEAETYGHTTRVAFHGGVEVALYTGEVDNLVEFAGDFLTGHAHDAAVHVDVLTASHLGVEAGAHLKEGADAATGADDSGGGGGDGGEKFQQGGLAGAIAADDAYDIAFFHVKSDVAQSPHILGVAFL